ncbi:Uncharacterized protein CH35J_007669 [Colletotrichum higginsianum]|uniref:CBF1-interacting co-repressor CIR N-terminal domain-containing protein n=1 Tax=Colletotrichum higginsianum TaxID=80884 RepID=A0A4T0VXN8_9PEZI|nr:Uncharacterized protein CH35J_007669 [Colletotrichum higginsianum]
MPLHLLGKKSWNVYNADNIARVRRDEAAAKAKEEAEEQRMQEVDAERRLAILRGEAPPPLAPVEAPEDEPRPRDRDAGSAGREKKKRKRAGEDDTEFELRVAKERADVLETANDTLRKSTSSAPIVDSAGHIDLFGEERKQGRHLKNEEAEKEAAKKKKELEDQYTMRFSNAAGRDGLVGPWYAASGAITELEPPRCAKSRRNAKTSKPSDRENWNNYAWRRSASARRGMSGGDEIKNGLKNDTSDLDPKKGVATKKDMDPGRMMTVAVYRPETMSAPEMMAVATEKEASVPKEGSEMKRDDQQSHKIRTKQQASQKVKEASGTRFHNDDRTVDEQGPVREAYNKYRGTQHIYI